MHIEQKEENLQKREQELHDREMEVLGRELNMIMKQNATPVPNKRRGKFSKTKLKVWALKFVLGVTLKCLLSTYL